MKREPPDLADRRRRIIDWALRPCRWLTWSLRRLLERSKDRERFSRSRDRTTRTEAQVGGVRSVVCSTAEAPRPRDEQLRELMRERGLEADPETIEALNKALAAAREAGEARLLRSPLLALAARGVCVAALIKESEGAREHIIRHTPPPPPRRRQPQRGREPRSSP